MKYITKQEIDRIALRLMEENFSFEARMEFEQYFGESYTKTQIERIWYRYQYIRSGNEENYVRKDRKQNQELTESDGRAGNRCVPGSIE